MARMTPDLASRVSKIMKAVRSNASAALCHVRGASPTDNMTDEQFKALAKEVEEVGELVAQLERINRHIVPALFEVPYGKWQGWSGLENYRNRLAHDFQCVTPEEICTWVTTKLALGDVSDLLGAVTSVGMKSEPFSFGVESDIKSLPQTSEEASLLPGASIIVLRFETSGELMAARSWRDEQDNWRASLRWVRTQAEDDERFTLGVRDTAIQLVPRPLAPATTERHDVWNLFVTPDSSYCWNPEILSQEDSILVRKKRRR